MKRAIRLNERDNVATMLEDVKEGEDVLITGLREEFTLTAVSDIPFGHKIALKDLKTGDLVIKYGEVIGAASRDIIEGEHVHIHNIRSIMV